MTLYRVTADDKVEKLVAAEMNWTRLAGSESSVILPENNPVELGSDASYKYVITDEV